MKNLKDVAWLAGLLEGEGSFGIANGSPLIQMAMVDRDIVEQAARMLDGPCKPTQPKGKPIYKLAWRTYVHGSTAVGWMLTLYTFLGKRRREAIRNVLKQWKESLRRPNAARRGEFAAAICHPERPVRANGLCRSCYMRRWHATYGKTRNTGNRIAPRPPRGQTIMASCHPARARFAKNLCKICYQHNWRLGNSKNGSSSRAVVE